jgi:hypothetical protein
VHDHWLVNRLLKLNGGFEIFADGTGYVLDYGRPLAADVATLPPVLMLPSREQQYTDPYFQAIFPKAVRLMRESTVLVIVGYSLPEEMRCCASSSGSSRRKRWADSASASFTLTGSRNTRRM